jgi:hypothetical protein
MEKIAILGTSNSITKIGYVPIYRGLEEGAEVINISLGNTIPSYGVLRFLNEQQWLKNADYCLIDFGVNTAQVLESQDASKGYCFSAFAALLECFLRQNRCTPIVLLFSPVQVMEGRMESASGWMKQICKLYHVPYIDIEALFLQNIPRSQARIYYHDKVHYGPEFSHAIAQFLKDLKPYCKQQWENQREAIKPMFHFETASNLNCMATNHVEEYKGTALIKQNCHVVETERDLCLPVTDMYLCSVLAWFTPGRSFTYVTGKRTIRLLTETGMPLFRMRDLGEYLPPNQRGFQVSIKEKPWDREIVDHRHEDGTVILPLKGAPLAVADFLFCDMDTPDKALLLLERMKDISSEEAFLLPEHYGLFSDLLQTRQVPLIKRVKNVRRVLKFHLKARLSDNK